MDNQQYHQNAMSASNSPYPSLGGGSSLPNISPHQLQQNHNGLPTTLPPLQASQHAQATMQSLYGGGSAPHTPRTPATPNTPNPPNGMGNFNQMQQQNRGYQMMGAGNYQQPPQQQQQQYRTTTSMMPQSTTAMSHPQAIAPAPAGGRMGQQPLRPMPPNGLHGMGAMQGYGQNNMMMPNELEPPTHVVGSQGRRGILPSAPGRPAVTATATGNKAAMIPAKDADGKFPCPHCTKTYLHAKHLKRHLLRHTGDRPYMCVLCRDTFSRSDILKRHFQKCSIRRGNPTGASHLSAQAHVKKQQPGVHKTMPAMANQNDLMGLNGMNGGMNNGLPQFGVHPNGAMQNAGPSLTNEQVAQLQRNEDIKRLSVGGNGDGSNRASFDQNYSALSGMPSGMNNPSLAYMPNRQSGHSFQQGYDYASHGNGDANGVQPQSGGQQHGHPWAPIYQSSNDPNGFANQYNASMSNPSVSIKSEFSSMGGHNNTYHNSASVQPHTDFWRFQPEILQQMSAKLNEFCFQNSPLSHVKTPPDIHKLITPESIDHLLNLHMEFEVHFPVVHAPTFRKEKAYSGLLLAMLTVGAVYSPKIVASQVREVMEFTRSVIESLPTVLSDFMYGRGNQAPIDLLDFNSPDTLEEVIAIFILHVLSTWHGTPVQREKARTQFPRLVELVRRLGLTTPSTGDAFSILHQPGLLPENVNIQNFSWNLWVQQEQRSRLLFAIYLTDAALVIYFNCAPLFRMDEIRLPLPADDAAYEARNAQECAEALGLHGHTLAMQRNPSGTRRLKQPELHAALLALKHPNYSLQPSSTTLYGKFILIHALQCQLSLAQKQAAGGTPLNLQNAFFPPSGSSTPLSQHDWINRTAGSASHSANNSGTATPVDGNPTHSIKETVFALEKWKTHWDADYQAQQPSDPHARLGFCRDAVHFYWLAKCLLKRPILDVHAAPDQRFSYIMQLLQVVKKWVMTDSAQRGELLGSASEIDVNYGLTDLTLDMSQLFKPLNEHWKSASNHMIPKMESI